MGHRGDHPTGGQEPDRTVNLRLVEGAARSTDFEIASDEPTTFGDYELHGELGSGGMGRVFKARQRSLGRFVALKTLRTRDFRDPGLVQRFHKEAEAAAQLDHPGIVPVYEFGTAEGQFYFTMGLVEGHGLDERLRQGPLDNRTAAILVQQVSEAVAYAHRKGVVHRDLKPANILLDQSGAAKITDFGIARRLNIKDIEEIEPAIQQRHPETVGTAIRLTQAGTILGTPGYMAPEQSTVKGKIGPWVDIWALGAILYSCLTGRPPFVGATAIETLALTVDTEPVPPNEINPEADPELVEICLRCLNKEIAERYSSADEVAAELARWREGKSIRSPWAIWRAKAARYYERMPELVPLITGLAVYRLSNIQEGLFVGCVLAGIPMAQRRKDVAYLILPAILSLFAVLIFPMVRVVPDPGAWWGGAIVSVAGLLAALTTLVCGIAALDVPRFVRVTPRNVAVACLVAALLSITLAAVALLGKEKIGSPGPYRTVTELSQVADRLAGWLVAVPLGLAVGAIAGKANQLLDRFGPEPLPAFVWGAAILVIAASFAFAELRVDSMPETSRLLVLGPGSALSTADNRAVAWMSRSGRAIPSEPRLAACAGIFWLKLLLFVVPMLLGGVVTSLVTRLVLGGRR